MDPFADDTDVEVSGRVEFDVTAIGGRRIEQHRRESGGIVAEDGVTAACYPRDRCRSDVKPTRRIERDPTGGGQLTQQGLPLVPEYGFDRPAPAKISA